MEDQSCNKKTVIYENERNKAIQNFYIKFRPAYNYVLPFF